MYLAFSGQLSRFNCLGKVFFVALTYRQQLPCREQLRYSGAQGLSEISCYAPFFHSPISHTPSYRRIGMPDMFIEDYIRWIDLRNPALLKIVTRFHPLNPV